MGNLLKKPTPAEEYAKNTIKINKSKSDRDISFYYGDLKDYYKQIEFLKKNPEKLNDKSYIFSLSRILKTLNKIERPEIDVEIENQLKTNYDNFVKSGEYEKYEEERKKQHQLWLKKHELIQREDMIKNKISKLEKELKRLNLYDSGENKTVNSFKSEIENLKEELQKLKQTQDTQFGRKKRKRSSFGKHRKWSMKYKRSINCKRPKGFSQKQYCKYGRKK